MHIYFSKCIGSLKLHFRPIHVFTTFLILLTGFARGQSIYSYTGSAQTYTFTSTACIKVKAWGAGGGIGASDVAGNGGTGGGGAYVEQMISVNNGDVLQ